MILFQPHALHGNEWNAKMTKNCSTSSRDVHDGTIPALTGTDWGKPQIPSNRIVNNSVQTETGCLVILEHYHYTT